MKVLSPYWHTPKHQVQGKEEVSFQLRPIDQRTYYEMALDVRPRGIGFDGMSAAFMYAVIDWKGLPQVCTPDAKRALLHGEPDSDMAIWQYDIAGECYRRAILKDDEAKNS